MGFRAVSIFLAILGAICTEEVISQEKEKLASLERETSNAGINDDFNSVTLGIERNAKLDTKESYLANDDKVLVMPNSEEEITKVRTEIGEKGDKTSDVIRLETIENVVNAKNESLSLVTPENFEVQNTKGTVGTHNVTINETSNVNVTTKAFPKRVKCLQGLKTNNMVDIDKSPSSDISGVEKVVMNGAKDDNQELINDDIEPVVQVINGSLFLNFLSERHNPNITNRSTAGECSIVIFYAPWCPFSAMAAPSFNGLARLFPDIVMYAVDSSKNQGINTQFGILALPTLIMFHNTKPIAKFNQSSYLIENFSEFITTFTGLEPLLPVEVADRDIEGPMPTKAVPEPDYYLYLAWLFTIACALGYFWRSSYCEWIIESVRSNWREAEIQHEHID